MNVHRRQLSVVPESSDLSEHFWNAYSYSNWGGDRDLEKIAHSIDSKLLPSQKFAELNRILSEACSRKDYAVRVNNSRQVKIIFNAQISSSADSLGLDHLLLMAQMMRHRSLVIFWQILRCISPALNEVDLEEVGSIRKFIKAPENREYFSSIRWLGCELAGPSTLVLFPRELEHLKGLTHLEVRNFGLSFLPARIFKAYPHLKLLDLSFNRFKKWRLSASEFPRLKDLLLVQNRIKYFSFSRDDRCRLKKIELRGNPIHLPF